jgi:hypothetical protein
MSSVTRRVLLAVAVLGLAVGAAGRARADIMITLDDATPTVIAPTTGTLEVDFKGTVTATLNADTGTATFGGSMPAQMDGQSLFSGNGNVAAIAPVLENGGTFTGVIFSIFIAPNTPPGTYTGGTYQLEQNVQTPTDTPVIVDVSWGITVESPTAVPEPSTLAYAATGVLMWLGYAWRRRKVKPAA